MSSDHVDSSGVQKLPAEGGAGGKAWDDGSDHDVVKRILVKYDNRGIMLVRFHYVRGEQHKDLIGDRGQYSGNGSVNEIEIKHPGEYLTSVEGWYDAKSNVIQGIQFIVKGKDTQRLGNEFPTDGRRGIKFSLQALGKKIIGFHGYTSGDRLNSIGAYVRPIGDFFAGVAAGPRWDDGHVFDGVRVVHVSQGDIGITMVKFVYGKGGEAETREHGKLTLGMTDTFELDYPSEYITSVECKFDKIHGSEDKVMNMLRFTTNKRVSDPFGLNAGETKHLKVENGYKIVGFYGNTGGEFLHGIGLNVLPITN